jgi:hypothetical protein
MGIKEQSVRAEKLARMGSWNRRLAADEAIVFNAAT